jgi:hypothetical protein
MSERMYRVYHKNSDTRTVAVTDIVTSSRKKAIEEGLQDAKRWNWGETRENMRVHFLECEGARKDL